MPAVQMGRLDRTRLPCGSVRAGAGGAKDRPPPLPFHPPFWLSPVLAPAEPPKAISAEEQAESSKHFFD